MGWIYLRSTCAAFKQSAFIIVFIPRDLCSCSAVCWAPTAEMPPPRYSVAKPFSHAGAGFLISLGHIAEILLMHFSNSCKKKATKKKTYCCLFIISNSPLMKCGTRPESKSSDFPEWCGWSLENITHEQTGSTCAATVHDWGSLVAFIKRKLTVSPEVGNCFKLTG